MRRLHTLGMSEDDSLKLLAMRGYIFSIAIARRRYATCLKHNPSTTYVLPSSANLASTGQERDTGDKLLDETEASLVNLGVNPQTIIFSTGEGRYSAEHLRQLREWPRHSSLRDLPRSSSSVDLLRQGMSRTASGSSTVDALRRRLASGNGSFSLQSGPPSRRTSMNMMRPNLPASPSSVASRPGTTDEASSEASHAGKVDKEELSRSSATIKPPSSVTGASTSTRARSKINPHGVEVSKVHAAVSSDMTTALGQLTLESQTERTSVSGVSETDRSYNATPAKVEGRFSTTYGKEQRAVCCSWS